MRMGTLNEPTRDARSGTRLPGATLAAMSWA